MKKDSISKFEHEAAQLERKAEHEVKAIEHKVAHEVKVLERKTRRFDSFWYLILFAVGYFVGSGLTWLYFKPSAISLPLFVDSMLPKVESLGLAPSVINYQRAYLSRDKSYLRVPVIANTANYYPLQNEIMPEGFSALRNEAYYWVDLSQVSLPVNKMVEAVTDSAGQIAYITTEGRGYLYDAKNSSLTLLPEELNFDSQGCRPALKGFSPGGRFLTFASVGETEFCPDFGIYDTKLQKMLTDGAGNHEQSYAFYSVDGNEKYVIRFSGWVASGEPIVVDVGDVLSIFDVETGESRIIKDSLGGGVSRLEVRKNSLIGVSHLGEEDVIVSNISQYLP